MTWLWVPVVLALGAVGRRIAGGVLNEWAGLAGGVNARVMGDTPARLIFGAMVALAGLLAGMPVLLFPAMVLAVWIGTTTGNSGIAMGRGSKTTFAADWWACALHGAACAAPIDAITGYWLWDHPGRWLLVSLGFLTCPLWYEVAWDVAGLNGKPKWPNGLRNGPAVAEALWGAVSALCLFAAFVQ